MNTFPLNHALFSLSFFSFCPCYQASACVEKINMWSIFFVKPHTHTHKEREKERGRGKEEGAREGGGGKRGTKDLNWQTGTIQWLWVLALRQPQMSVGAAISRTGSSSRQLAMMDQTWARLKLIPSGYLHLKFARSPCQISSPEVAVLNVS